MRFGSVKLTVVLLLVVCVGSVLPAWGQASDTGTVVGRVSDPTGAVVVGAKVTLTDASTSQSTTATTNDAGRYTFVSVKPGIYNISITKTGFSTTKTEHQEVKVGTTLTVDLALQIGGANVVVEVTAAGNELQTMDATVGQTITGDALDSLPGLGRDVSTFVTLQPGVAPDGSVGGANQDQNSFQLDGGNNSSDMDGTQNTYTASFAGDPTGGLVNNEVTGTAPGGSPGGGGPTGVMPTPADSIEEFRVATNNQTADFNSSAGAEVKLVTKRGTNQWHGTAYEYYFDNNWGANTFDNNASGTPRPSYHYNRFGGSVGGPLSSKDVLGGKWFFFANYEGFRWPNSATATKATPSDGMRYGLLQDGGTAADNYADSTVYNLNPGPTLYPSTAAAIGALVPGTVYPGSGTTYDPRGLGISPTIQALWQFMPESNQGTACLGLSRCDHVNVQAFRANYPVLWKDNFGVTRLDHDFASKWHFYSTYRYYHQQRATSNQIDIGGFAPGDKIGVPASVAARPSVPWYFTASLSTNITNNVTNDFHYSFLRNWWGRQSLADPPQVSGLGGALEPEGETSTNVLAPLNLDTQDVRTRFWDGKDHMFRDDLSWVKGKHFFTFGGLYQHNYDYHQRTDNGLGTNYQPVYILGDGGGGPTNGMDMTGNPLAGLDSKFLREYGIVLGVPGVTQISYIRAGADLSLQTPVGTVPAYDQSTIPYYNLYFNDSWHIKPTVTLSYGLGWTLEMPPTEKNGKQVAAVDPDGKLINAQAYLNTRANDALSGQVYNPEIGFALLGNVTGHPTYLYNPYYKSFSPRIAAAWNPQFESDSMGGKIFGHNNTVIRGGYSILYGRLNGVGQVLGPLLGYGLIQGVQCVAPRTDGTCAGSGGSTPTSAFRIGPTANGFDGLVAPLPVGTPTLPQPAFPGVNSTAGVAPEAFDPNFRPSVNQQFDLTIQRQINSKVSIEVGYIGRKITHEFQPVNLNAVPYMMTVGGQRFDKAYGQMVSQFCGLSSGSMAGGGCATNVSAVTAQPFFETAIGATSPYCTTAVGGITPANCTQAVALNEASNISIANVWSLYSDLDNGVFNFPRSMMNTPVPGSPFAANGGQVTSGVGENTSFGWGNYNSFFASYKMSSWHGLTMQSNFTWGKALGTGSQVQATSGYTIDDPFNYGRSYGLQPWDRKFMFNLWFTYTPPFFQSQHGVIGHLLGGWTFAPIFDSGSGFPAGVYASDGYQDGSAYAGGQAFGGSSSTGTGLNSYDNAIYTCGGTLSSSRHDHPVGGGAVYGGNGYGPELYQDPGAVYNCFRNPILGIDNGHNGGAGNFRGQPFWNVDFSAKKNIRITERFGAEFGATFTNVFNHDQLYDPFVLGQGQALSDPGDWGALEGEVNNPRKIEVDFRLKF